VAFEPFDPAIKRSAASYATAGVDGGGVLHVVKGAPATLAALTHTPPATIGQATAALTAGRARILAVASGTGSTLTLAGLIALADPPRADSPALVSDLHAQGVRVVMVTGDGEDTARAVAARTGITGQVAPPGTITSHLDAVTADRYDAGHVVGMTGDGVNDAPALSQADVGIAVAAATDIAKASAGLVLTRPGLGEILTAVKGSRSIYQRLRPGCWP
jgi:H+-transporting ATPase